MLADTKRDKQTHFLFEGVDAEEDPNALKSKIRNAEFYILACEGERQHLAEDLADHAIQLVKVTEDADKMRKSNEKLSNENKILSAQLQASKEEVSALKESRDGLVGEKFYLQKTLHQLRQESEQQIRFGQQQIAELTRAAKEKAAKEKDSSKDAEELHVVINQLMISKIKLADACNRADNLRILVEYYQKHMEYYDPTKIVPIDQSGNPDPARAQPAFLKELARHGSFEGPPPLSARGGPAASSGASAAAAVSSPGDKVTPRDEGAEQKVPNTARNYTSPLKVPKIMLGRWGGSGGGGAATDRPAASASPTKGGEEVGEDKDSRDAGGGDDGEKPPESGMTTARRLARWFKGAGGSSKEKENRRESRSQRKTSTQPTIEEGVEGEESPAGGEAQGQHEEASAAGAGEGKEDSQAGEKGTEPLPPDTPPPGAAGAAAVSESPPLTPSPQGGAEGA
uniref:Uncharacterized protein n=1 Tax=Chromera velia CCMP2878 TaxID=1169474 RepID=A0A0G4IC82_9ALVE|eukprot:Cvel_13047.t1-p1 / transcript=Cvel_13047.t1 / gene=Cvel_13047 / organism=Chromera_velia_CCMP2878 / gene_product=hypothetical protein / transcript_product=hypothetical protein / location=Cvel_scaffold876:52345-54924(+) / protein_length=454 / sequence_SO=supercontig / SO=protein_coding / is_pseudo=false